MLIKYDQLKRAQINSQNTEKIDRLIKQCHEDGTIEKVVRTIEKRMRVASDILFEEKGDSEKECDEGYRRINES